MGSQKFTGHILLIPVAAYGHLMPMTVLASRIVQQRPDVAVTFLTAGSFYDVAEREFTRHFQGKEDLRCNIRHVKLGGEGFDFFGLLPVVFQAFPQFYQNLVDEKPVQCTTGKIYDTVPKPNAAIIDYFLNSVYKSMRSITGQNVPIFAWSSGSTPATIRLFGPELLGGLGNVAEKARVEAERTGRRLEDVANEIMRPAKGNVLQMAGLPPMYDYEFFPQEEPTDHPVLLVYESAYICFEECDGIVANAVSAYEQASIDAFRSWLSRTDRKYSLYALGPLLPPDVAESRASAVAKQKDIDSSDIGDHFESFLDGALAKHGEDSLIYLSFGSVWWPRNEHVWMFVDTLIDLGIPFVLSHASPKAVVPPEYVEKVKKSGLGLLSKWCPQQTVLNHPVTGWFVTHCGNNSVTEALSQGKPMIAWPVDADQPANAITMSLTLDVAFELIEVRTGHGLKPLYRGVTPVGTAEAAKAEVLDVLRRARGEEGARKRRNAKILQGELKRAWEEGGEASENLRGFFKDISFGPVVSL